MSVSSSSGAVPSLAAASPAATRRARRARWARRHVAPSLPAAGRRPERAAWRCRPSSRYRVVTYAGQTKLKDRPGPTPSNHDGTAVFNASAWSAAPDPEPRARRGGGARRTARRRDGLRPGCAERPAGAPSSRPTVGPQPTASGSASPAPPPTAPAGPTPWGTWLTCEETETKAGTAWTGSGQSGTYARDHGYVFEVFADGTDAAQADQGLRPLRARGAARSTRAARGSTSPRTPAAPTASSTAGPRRAASGSGPGIADQLGPRRGHPRGDGDRHGRRIGAARRGLPDLRPARSAVPGAVGPGARPRRPDHRGAQAVHRRQVTRGKKFEGVFGTDEGRLRRQQLRLQHG